MNDWINFWALQRQALIKIMKIYKPVLYDGICVAAGGGGHSAYDDRALYVLQPSNWQTAMLGSIIRQLDDEGYLVTLRNETK